MIASIQKVEVTNRETEPTLYDLTKCYCITFVFDEEEGVPNRTVYRNSKKEVIKCVMFYRRLGTIGRRNF